MHRDEDHLALFIELLGRMPKRISGNGKYVKDYFNRHGELRHIKKMRFWPLDKVLTEKYHLPEDEVSLFATQVVASASAMAAYLRSLLFAFTPLMCVLHQAAAIGSRQPLSFCVSNISTAGLLGSLDNIKLLRTARDILRPWRLLSPMPPYDCGCL